MYMQQVWLKKAKQRGQKQVTLPHGNVHGEPGTTCVAGSQEILRKTELIAV